MKPDWKDAPEWARWLAQDKNGYWCWFRNEPVANDKAEIWDTKAADVSYQEAGHSRMRKWRESLEKHP